MAKKWGRLPPVVRKILVGGLLGLLGGTLVAYVVDGVQIRVRLAMGGEGRAYDSVTVMPAVALKGSRYEVYGDQRTTETCARAIFPQMGYSPCWYVREHAMKLID